MPETQTGTTTQTPKGGCRPTNPKKNQKTKNLPTTANANVNSTLTQSSHPPISFAHFAFLISALSASVMHAHTSSPPAFSTISSSHFSSRSSSFFVFFRGGGGGGGRGGVFLFGCKGAMPESRDFDDFK